MLPSAFYNHKFRLRVSHETCRRSSERGWVDILRIVKLNRCIDTQELVKSWYKSFFLLTRKRSSLYTTSSLYSQKIECLNLPNKNNFKSSTDYLLFNNMRTTRIIWEYFMNESITKKEINKYLKQSCLSTLCVQEMTGRCITTRIALEKPARIVKRTSLVRNTQTTSTRQGKWKQGYTSEWSWWTGDRGKKMVDAPSNQFIVESYILTHTIFITNWS